MKKIVALLMVLAIVAGAFAADISAALNTGVVLVMDEGNGAKLNTLYDAQDGGDGFGDANLLYVSVDGEKAGAYFKIRGGTDKVFVKHYGVWFKPADAVKFTVGNHNTVYAFDTAHFGWWTPLGTGVDTDAGWSVEITPIDPLYIGFHMTTPIDEDSYIAAEDAADLSFKAAVKYSIDGFGSIGLEGTHGYGAWAGPWATFNGFALGAEINAIENVGIGVVGTGYIYDDVYDPMFKAEVAVNASVGADIYFLSRTLIRTTENNDKLGQVLFARADYYFDNFSIYGLCGFGMNVGTANGYKVGEDEVSGIGFGSADYNDVAFGAVDSTHIWAEVGVPISIDMVTVTPAFVFRSTKVGDIYSSNRWYLPIRVSIEY